MKFGKPRRQLIAGMLEKLGITTVIASIGDLVITHKLDVTTDFIGLAAGLILMVIAVIVMPYE